MANMQTDTSKTTPAKKPQTQQHHAEDLAEEPPKPSRSRWGGGKEDLGGGVDIGGIQPGNSNGANYS